MSKKSFITNFHSSSILNGAALSSLEDISKKSMHKRTDQCDYKIPVITLQTNTIGTTYLFESIKESEYNPVIVSVSTSEVYGNPTKDETDDRIIY